MSAIGSVFARKPPLWTSSIGTYIIHAHFPNAAGATKGTPVRLLGIEIGKVGAIKLDETGGGVIMELLINDSVIIRSDAPVAIKQEGFIANLYVEFGDGQSPETLPVDDTAVISGKIDTFAAYIEQVTMVLSESGYAVRDKVSEVTEGLTILVNNINELAGDTKFREDIKSTMSSVNEISAKLKVHLPAILEDLESAVAKADENLEKIPALVETYKELGGDLTLTSKAAREQIKRQGKNLDELTASLIESSNNFSKLAGDLSEVSQMVKSGEGTVGKLFQDPELFRSLVNAIDTLSDAAEEFKNLARPLKDHPDWLLKPPKNRR